MCVFLLVFQIACISQFPMLLSYANFQDFQALSKKLCVILSNFKLFGLCHVYVLFIKGIDIWSHILKNIHPSFIGASSNFLRIS